MKRLMTMLAIAGLCSTGAAFAAQTPAAAPAAKPAKKEKMAKAAPMAYTGCVATGAKAGSYELKDATAAGSTDKATYDLKGGGGELDVLNRALAMTAVKLVLVEVTTPGASASLQFGPQGQTNAATLWYQANTANFWSEVRDRLMNCNSVGGWALDSTHKVIAIKNPGASTVAGTLWVIGTM